MERKKITLEMVDNFMKEPHKIFNSETDEFIATALGLPIGKVKKATENFEALKRAYSTLSKKERMGLVEMINNKDGIVKKENTEDYICSCGCHEKEKKDSTKKKSADKKKKTKAIKKMVNIDVNNISVMREYSNAYICISGDKYEMTAFVKMVAAYHFATELSIFEENEEDMYPIMLPKPEVGSFDFERGYDMLSNYYGDIEVNWDALSIDKLPKCINTLMLTKKSGKHKVKVSGKIDLFNKYGDYIKTDIVSETIDMMVIPFIIKHDRLGKKAAAKDFDEVYKLLRAYNKIFENIRIFMSGEDGADYYTVTENGPGMLITPPEWLMEECNESKDDLTYASYSVKNHFARLKMTRVNTKNKHRIYQSGDKDGNVLLCEFKI